MWASRECIGYIGSVLRDDETSRTPFTVGHLIPTLRKVGSHGNSTKSKRSEQEDFRDDYRIWLHFNQRNHI